MIQVSKKVKTLDKEKLLLKQNKIRKKYGLPPLKRLQPEMVLYMTDDSRFASSCKKILREDGIVPDEYDGECTNE